MHRKKKYIEKKNIQKNEKIENRKIKNTHPNNRIEYKLNQNQITLQTDNKKT